MLDPKSIPLETKLFINGEYVDALSGLKFDVLNPSTEQIITQVQEAGKEDVDRAVTAARKAFDEGDWTKISAYERGRIIAKFADLIQKHTQQLAVLETYNNGKTLAKSLAEDLAGSVTVYRYYAGWPEKIRGSTFQINGPFLGFTKKEPVGVVAQIIPWNYPLMMQAWKMAPALAAGCTIVIKPAEQTPLTALKLGHLINEAGFPKGVINIISGAGQTGSYLAKHQGVDKVAFTGSTEVGYKIMKQSHVSNLKRITLELGGKSANIIFDDVDLDQAANLGCSVFGNAGQSCIAGSRTFVHESIYEKFVEKAVEIAKNIKVGDPFDASTNQGPVICYEQFTKILGYIESGKSEGAKIAIGGNRIGQKGYFIAPTIFYDVQDHMKIAREEIFGPVMSIFKFSTEEEVIKRANQLNYGLGSGIVTKNIERAFRVMTKLKSGTVYINCYDIQDATTPFGGYKDSGMGRELGEQGLNPYLELKTIVLKK